MHAGPAHEGAPACRDRHCWHCHRDGPQQWAMACSECLHAWRWGWMLSLHDARTWWRLDHRLRLRRPGKIWICPACSHDF
jgi:hypothetical protein